MSGVRPFHGDVRALTLPGKVVAKKEHSRLSSRDSLWDLLYRCWDSNLQSRPTVSEVLLDVRTVFLLQSWKGTDHERFVAGASKGEHFAHNR